MALSRAEIQHRYRERKKLSKDGPRYVENERRRQRNNYVPVVQLSRANLVKRNEKIRARVRKYRMKRKLERVAQENVANNPEPVTSGYETENEPGTSGHHLVVRLPSIQQNSAKRRNAKGLAKAHRKIKELKTKNENLERKLRSSLRKIQRFASRASFSTPLTPRSETKLQLRRAGLRGPRADKIKKRLLVGNVLLSSMRANAKDGCRKKRRRVYSTVAGSLVAKYRCMDTICKSTSLNRNTLSSVIQKGINFMAKQKDKSVVKHRQSVLHFLLREDNCITMPSKRDSKKVGVNKIQKRILTDYLGNLYLKYMAENPTRKISLASFCRIRPAYILTANFLKRNSCLCTKHQNIALKLKMLKSCGLPVTLNPDEYLKGDTIIETGKLPSKVSFSVWKRVPHGDKKKIKIVQEEMTRDEFLTVWEEDLNFFKDHVFRVRAQFREFRSLKENLPLNEAIIQMDFSENYSCKSADEIQSAYWTQTQVTLHPIVVYYREPETSILVHKSFVAVSDEGSHRASTILAILDILFQNEINQLPLPELNYIHYWTDSPTSQYRNKYIFYAIKNHEDLFGCPSTWNYFEAGHGKGACDGIGGTAKRMADNAVKTGAAFIQDADDFFKWASSLNSEIQYFFVPKMKCAEKAQEIASWPVKPMRGTMKLHAYSVGGDRKAIWRETSCYCEKCLTDEKCDTWTASSTHVSETYDDCVTCDKPELEYSAGDYIAAVYETKWYVGRVIDVDETEVEISFMKRRKNMFQWPQPEDVIWVSRENILLQLKHPLPSGKFQRMYRITEEDAIELKFDAWKK